MRTRRCFPNITLTLVCMGFLATSLPARAEDDPPHGHLAPILDEETEKQRKTEQLERLEPPPFIQHGDTSRLVFQTAPLSSEGVLSKQVRRALRYLAKRERQGRLVHLRAFVAGSGDTRRVQAVVSEELTKWRRELPSLSVIQVGKLARTDANIQLEAVADTGKTVNPGGLAFVSGQLVASGEAVLTVAPLVAKSARQIEAAARELGSEPGADVLRVTCYCSSVDDSPEIRRELASAFPSAALSFVQLRRVYTTAAVTCDSVVRLPESHTGGLAFENPEQLPSSDERSQVVILPPGPVYFSGAQLAFGSRKEDVRLAFERLQQSVEEAGSAGTKIAASHFYLLSNPIREIIRELRFDFFDKSQPPVSTMVEVDGLPSLDATFAVEVVAVPAAQQ